MPSVRILLGALSASMQVAVTEVVRSHVGMEVVGVAVQPSELLLAAGVLRADVVLVGATDVGLPGVASHLLDQYPHLKVLAVAGDGRQVLIYALRPQVARVTIASVEDLVRTIQTAVDDPAED